MYVGLPGTGKTLSMVEYLLRLRNAYPKIKIYTNFGFKYEDGRIESIDDFKTIESPDGVVFAVDEVQLSFQARKYSSFPVEMIYVLTQNRKFRKHFVCTAQLFEHVDKAFRDLTNIVVDCKSFKQRWFRQKAYIGVEYKKHYDVDSRKAPLVMWRYSYVAPDWLFSLYDTLKVVESFDREKRVDKREMREYVAPATPDGAGAPMADTDPQAGIPHVIHVRFERSEWDEDYEKTGSL